MDRLLWTVLWKPLNLPRNIRDSYKIDAPQIDLIAVDNKAVVGALVANWLSEKELEIRHIAVKSDYQENSIGSLLVEELLRIIKDKVPLRIQSYARNTSLGFFTRLGFKPTGERLDQQNYIKHGIWIQQMFTELTEDDRRLRSL